MAFAESWVETDPDGSVITGSLLDDFQRQHKRAIRERLEGDPANANSGIFESGSLAATAIVRAGTARAYAVTAAGVAALTLQDGRIAITTDTKRLFHLKATGAVELDYIPSAGGAGINPAFGVVSAAGFLLNAVGTYAAGKVYKDAVNGLILSGVGGSSYDAVITNSAGLAALRVPTATQNIVVPGSSGANAFDIVNAGAGWAAGRIYRDVNDGILLAGYPGGTNNVVLTDGVGQTVFRIPNTGTLETFTTGKHSAASFQITGVAGGFAQGKLYRDPTHGLVLGGSAGTANDVILANSAGALALRVPTGAVDIVVGGGITAVTTINSPLFAASTAFVGPGTAASTGHIRLSAAGNISVRNAANTADISMLATAGGVVTVDAETSITLNKVTTVNGNVLSTGFVRVGTAASAVSAGQLAMGSNSSTTATTGGGGVTPLPGTPAGYLTWFLGATNIKVPYYNA